jgi:hypothetical protein
MFPFLSVLCSLIGVLTLFLIGIVAGRAIGALGGSSEADPYGAGGANGAAREPWVDETASRSYRAQIDALTRQLFDCHAECERLARLETEAEAFLEAREQEMAAAQKNHGLIVGRPLGAKDRVRVIPDPHETIKVLKKPILVEVTAEGFVVHPQRRPYAAAELDRAQSPLISFLEDVDKQRDVQYLLLLLHPNGKAAYVKLRRYLIAHLGELAVVKTAGGPREVPRSRIDLGVEPYSSEWELADPPGKKEQ